MKTYKQWDESDIDLDEFLWKDPCEIDEEIHNHLWETVAPKYCDSNFLQCWEANAHCDWIGFHMTTMSVGDKYWYLWILPEFMQ